MVIYSFIYYRGLGLVSVSSLLIAALLAYLSVVLLSKYQNFTMSLSAIAGLVVAIGITADSFIVYFERLRDEVREGKTLRPAVEAAGSAPGARSWCRTRCRSSRRCCCTTSRSATCRASPTRSA